MIDISRNSIGSDRPDSSIKLSLVQLTDLHIRSYGKHDQEVIRVVHQLDPDIIALTGDIVDKPGGIDALDTFMEELPAGNSRYAILGNWEYAGNVDLDQLRSIYDSHDCRILVDETHCETNHGREFLITGVDDYKESQPDIRKALQEIKPRENHIVLSHCPGYRDEINAMLHSKRHKDSWIHNYQFTAMLSGHTHGGQVTLFGFAPILPRGSHGYVSGWYTGNGIPLYVSRGIASTGIPIRFMCPPEISYFEWNLK